jgi:hypothetical protein
VPARDFGWTRVGVKEVARIVRRGELQGGRVIV